MGFQRPSLLNAAVIALAVLASAAPAQQVTECLVQAGEVARIGASDRGVFASVAVSRSDPVTKGQIIATLKASQETAKVKLAQLRVGSDIAVHLAQAKAETAELNATRLTKLVKQGLVQKSEQEAAILAARAARLEEEEAVYQLEVAKVQLNAALSAQERKKIRAPFSGVVTDVLVSVGEVYSEQTPVIVMARIDPLHVEAYLPASRRAEVMHGTTALVRLETGSTHAATVEVVDAVLDAATGTFGVRLTLPNPDGDILAGQSCAFDFVASN